MRMKVQTKVKRERKKQGLTIEAMALKSNMNQSSYRKVEDGVRNSVDKESAKKIANALGVKVSELFGPMDRYSILVSEGE